MSLQEHENQTWVIGVSGGPDSMALLDCAHFSGVKCIVVHVNYHKRETAFRDQKLLETYCNQHSIPYYVFDALDLKEGNFQARARDFRYEKMREVANKHSADALAVAHHYDDDIETFIFQKKRKSNVNVFGLRERSVYKGKLLLRPLLKYTKEELIKYCNKNNINYGWDESNENEVYSRNRIRKNLALLSSEDKKTLYHEKEKLNRERIQYLNDNASLLNEKTIPIEIFLKLDHPLQFLLEWLKMHQVNKALSYKFLEETIRQIEVSSSFILKCGRLRIVKQYNKLSLLPLKAKKYDYKLEKIENLITDFFELSFDERTNNYVKKDDFPLRITNANTHEMKGSIKLSRWFIKHKIPLEKRELWPMICASNNKLLFIPNVSFMRGSSANKIVLTVVK